MATIERAVDWNRYEDELAASRTAALADAVVADAGQRRRQRQRRVLHAVATACGVVAVGWVILSALPLRRVRPVLLRRARAAGSSARVLLADQRDSSPESLHRPVFRPQTGRARAVAGGWCRTLLAKAARCGR